ncbi:MAG: 3-hydroxyacyl-ACP dehydratase FabZ [Proteobacteria bacterium]|nr:3-hydroxyacyl-ACP dehydratase FabZ [Pseudomonadota bacterium]
MSVETSLLDAAGIMDLLPHRYPFLLIDKIVECTPHEQITATKNVTADEPYFEGHFPGNPVMPGVLVIETMAQAGGVLSHISNGDIEPRPLYYLAGIDSARFRRPVTPGDLLTVCVEKHKVKRGIWWYRCEATVDGNPVASATIICAPGGDRT